MNENYRVENEKLFRGYFWSDAKPATSIFLLKNFFVVKFTESKWCSSRIQPIKLWFLRNFLIFIQILRYINLF